MSRSKEPMSLRETYQQYLEEKLREKDGARMLKDLSSGLEKYPIPVFNHLNNIEVDPKLNYIMACPGPPTSNQTVKCCNCKPGECSTDACSCRKMSKAKIKDHRISNIDKVVGNPMSMILVECREGCACKRNCENWIGQPHINFRTQLEYFDKKGYGVILKDYASKGDYFGEYTGEIMDPTRRSNLAYQFAVEYEDKKKNLFIIDARIKGNLTRFVNHSCNPSMRPFIFVRSAINNFKYPQLGFVFVRDVAPDEELTIDYGDAYIHGVDYDCCCGSSKCVRQSEETKFRNAKEKNLAIKYEKQQQDIAKELVKEHEQSKQRQALIDRGISAERALRMIPPVKKKYREALTYQDGSPYPRPKPKTVKEIEVITLD